MSSGIKTIYVLLLAFLFLNSFGQSIRMEIESKSAIDQYNIVPIGEKGIIIFYETMQSESARNEKWIFSKYDTSFNEIWTTEYPLLNNLSYSKYYVDTLFMYALFVYGRQFEIVKLNIETSAIEVIKGSSAQGEMQVQALIAQDGNLYFGGNLAPSESKVFARSTLGFIFFPLMFIPNFMPEREAFLTHVNLETKVSRGIDFGLKGFSSVASIAKDTFNNKIYVLLKNANGRNSTIHFQDFKTNGQRSKASIIKPFTKQYQLLDGKLSVINTSESVLLGTYSKNGNSGSQGFYFSKIVNGKQDFIQYHSFTTFKNFFEYLNVEEKERIQKRIQRKKARGKDLDLDYRLLIHDLISDSIQYTMVAEAYQPRFHTEFRTVWMYGRPMEQPYEVFDGYQYSHAIIAAFDTNGRLKWDNWFSINNIMSYNLNEKVKAIKNGDSILLGFHYKGIIKYKNIYENQISDHVINPENDKPESNILNYYNNLDFWYKNYMIAYGIERASDDEYFSKRNTVFYLNKIQKNVEPK